MIVEACRRNRLFAHKEIIGSDYTMLVKDIKQFIFRLIAVRKFKLRLNKQL